VVKRRSYEAPHYALVSSAPCSENTLNLSFLTQSERPSSRRWDDNIKLNLG